MTCRVLTLYIGEETIEIKNILPYYTLLELINQLEREWLGSKFPKEIGFYSYKFREIPFQQNLLAIPKNPKTGKCEIRIRYSPV